ncbi:unnamed protein product, partial [Ectocarpus fasciculatus]
DTAVVTELWIYPIKSCRGIKVRHAEIDERGLKYDRNYMVVSGPKNRFISQRGHPRMATIAPEIDSAAGTMTLTAPGMEDLCVPLRAPKGAAEMDVMVWNTTCAAQEISPDASGWIARYLEIPAGCKLVKISDSFVRRTDPKVSLNNGQTAFADSFPFLLASVSSLAAVNEKLDSPVPMDNFRPNIVVKGCDRPYAEDSWKRVIFNKTLAIDVAQPCSRCKMPNNNQFTGVMDEKTPVSKMLQKYRNGKDLNFEEKSGVFFG